MAIKKVCGYHGCKKIIDIANRYCQEHMQEYEKYLQKLNKQRQAKYDKEVRRARDKQYVEFYNSNEWQAVRLAAINRDHALCVICYKEKRIEPFHTVHHVKPIKTQEGWEKRLDLDNLICVCEYHHQMLHRKMQGQGG